MKFGASFYATLHSTMTDLSPSKRRKTRGAFAMKPKKVSVTWPADELPVEIFTLIITHLPRSNILNMRLVNKEFDRKVAEFLFRVVVVPFRPEIYGITPERTITMGTNAVIQSSIMLQDRGMRVFQGFGPHIQKFAMSFEIDHNKLAHPPLKSDQEAITSFWGIYRWPFKDYNRYSQLEGLEQTADETKTMQQALRYVNSAKELGISIDGGLGWLPGPDTNERVVSRGESLAVFNSARFVPETNRRQNKSGKSLRSIAFAEAENNGLYSAFERMLREAGYTGANLEPSVRMLLQSEDFIENMESMLTPQASFSASNSPESTGSNGRVLGARRRRHRFNLRAEELDIETGATRAAPDLFDTLLSDDDDFASFTAEEQEAQPAVATTRTTKAKSETYPLKPNDLTNAQREMLLEMEWAQSAFMNSFVIAIIDNTTTFANIQSLTVARLPHGHLSKLKREDFWDSLPRLNRLSLAVIPDWRKVQKEATGWVQDDRVVPSESIVGVYDLLSEQIANRDNITTLHFEWLCGGEYAPGILARNNNILPAPFVSEAKHMVYRAQTYPVLNLKYVEHLSLKNCWITPHIMSMALFPLKSTLQSLRLDSVSLSAPVTPGIQPQPLTAAAVAQQAQGGGGGGGGQGVLANMLVNLQQAGGNPQNGIVAAPQPAPAATQVPSEPSWVRAPRAGSWAQFIDMITPGTTLADMRHDRDLDEEPSPREPTKLTKLEFVSCGYIHLPLDFDQSVLDAPAAPAPAQNTTVTKKYNEIEGFMMKPNDPYLASIVNHISDVEVQTLENAWNMSTGWIDRPELVADAGLDGIRDPGNGRFDGLIEVARLSS